MEEKKYEKYDLERRRPVFFSIGMIISISLALVAFEWKTPIDPVVEYVLAQDDDEIVYIPPTTLQPPPPPPPKAIEIVEVKDGELVEEEIPELDIDVLEDEPIEEFIPIEEPEEVVESIFIFAEEMPSFPGGDIALLEYIARHIKYPKQAQRMGVEGKVHLRFVINEQGSVSNIEVMRGIGAGCDEEAVRVLASLPKFNPGKQRGNPVKVQMQVPINFRLN